jgi:hypothetical protein
MKPKTELTIRGVPDRLAHLFARVEESPPDGWMRDREEEERLGRQGLWGPWGRCFSCTADRPAARLRIRARSLGERYVSLVTPLGRESLTEEEGNRLQEEFARDVLGTAASELGVEVRLIPRRRTLEDDLSTEATRLLRAFSAAADRSCLRPDDRRRWNAFLVRVHQDEDFFDLDLLEDWLRQEGWPEEVCRQLVGEYDAAQSLLLTYDEEVSRR